MKKKPDLRERFVGYALPENIELEEDLLTHALNGSMSVILDYISTSSVFNNDYRAKVFESFISANSEGLDITPMHIYRVTGDKDMVGYCTKLKNRTPSELNIPLVCLSLIELDISRKSILKCTEFIETLYSDTTKSLTIVDDMSTFSQEITESLSQLNSTSFQKVKQEVIAELEKRVNNPDGVVVNSGIKEFDKVFGGFEKGTLSIFGARPGAGKTALMVQIAYNVAVKLNKKILFFNLEMTKEELVKRILALHTTNSNFTLKKGFDGNMEQFQRFKTLAETLKTDNIIIKDDIYDARQISQYTKRLVKSGVEIMILDYLQLSNIKDSGNREQEISKISRGLKKLSKDCQIPILSLTQLSRAVETRPGEKRPQLSDIRESGAIEQDADSVVFLYRPSYYNINETEDGRSTENLLELIIAKARNGFTGTVEVNYEPKYNKVQSINENDNEIGKIIGSIDDFEAQSPRKINLSELKF